MKILIVDDSDKNLAAAQEAAKKFEKELEFEFTTSAGEALAKLERVDAIITDLFFPPEQNEELLRAYEEYIRKTAESPMFRKVVAEYYHYDYQEAKDTLQVNLAVMREGTIRAAVERASWLWKDIKEYQEVLNNLPPAQFAYGGVLMLKAKRLRKKHVLVTDLHRHFWGNFWGNCRNHVRSVDGMIVLLPLMEAGIISIREATCDGWGSYTYIGRDRMYLNGREGGKENPEVWEEAIANCLAQ